MKLFFLRLVQYLTYLLLASFGFLISLLSYPMIHFLGRKLGRLLFHLHRSFRKKTLCNLAIAFGDSLSEKERVELGKKSFENLTITCLEFFRLKRSKNNLSEIVELEKREEILALMEKGQGVVFLTGHQANWEIPFLALTEKFPGIAIGRPVPNPWIYRWILSIREMFGGKIVMPRNAIRQGMKSLKEGKFIGIVGDQAFPESPYSYPLFGTRAWTTTTPALLAYKMNCPLVVGLTNRINGKYAVKASPSFGLISQNPAKKKSRV